MEYFREAFDHECPGKHRPGGNDVPRRVQPRDRRQGYGLQEGRPGHGVQERQRPREGQGKGEEQRSEPGAGCGRRAQPAGAEAGKAREEGRIGHRHRLGQPEQRHFTAEAGRKAHDQGPHEQHLEGAGHGQQAEQLAHEQQKGQG